MYISVKAYISRNKPREIPGSLSCPRRELSLAAAKFVLDGRRIETPASQQKKLVKPEIGGLADHALVIFAERRHDEFYTLLAHFSGALRGSCSELLHHVGLRIAARLSLENFSPKPRRKTRG